MNRAMGLLVLVALIGTLCSGCGASATTLGADDNGSEVTLKVGDTFEISLAGNPTTGYQWMLMTNTEPVLDHADDPEYVPDEVDKGVVGSGGTCTFTFEALEEGQVDLELGYMRVWESVPPIETYTLTVSVE